MKQEKTAVETLKHEKREEVEKYNRFLHADRFFSSTIIRLFQEFKISDTINMELLEIYKLARSTLLYLEKNGHKV